MFLNNQLKQNGIQLFDQKHENDENTKIITIGKISEHKKKNNFRV